LQALLEREKRAAEAAVNNEALKQRQEEQQRKQQQEELQRKQQQEEQLRKQQQEQLRKQQQLEQQRKQQEEAQQKVVKQLEQQQHQQFQHIQMQARQQQQQQQQYFQQQQQVTMTEEMRMAQEAQLAKLSVRLKVQRFESTGPAPINYIGQVSVSQSGSPRQSGMQTPVTLTGRNKPTQVSYAPPMTAKPSDIRLESNTKENSAPVHLPAKSLTIPRMTEQTHQNESLQPKVTVSHHIQPSMGIQQQQSTPQVLDPFAGVQLRQPSISTFQMIQVNVFC
jgi:hypothetical protein